MKKLLALVLVLGLATVANAALDLTVNNVVTGGPVPAGSVGILGDGATDPGTFYIGIKVGDAGTFNLSGLVINYTGSDKGVDVVDDVDIAEILGVNNLFLGVSLNDVPPPGTPKVPLTGQLVNGITVDGIVGTVTLILTDGDGVQIGQTILTPEPITLALLGLGGLFIRRK